MKTEPCPSHTSLVMCVDTCCSMLRQAYYFPLWDFNANRGKVSLYEQWHMHMVLFQGRDLAHVTPQHDMELYISTEVCRQSDRHCGAVGRGAIAAHLAYGEQAFSLLNSTDVLQHYHVLADSVCVREHSHF